MEERKEEGTEERRMKREEKRKKESPDSILVSLPLQILPFQEEDATDSPESELLKMKKGGNGLTSLFGAAT